MNSMDILEHSGTPQLYDGDPHGSGRYRQGSGENPNQHTTNVTWDEVVASAARKGMSENDISEGVGMSDYQLRKIKSIESQKKRAELYSRVYELADKGKTATEIGRELGKNESFVRSALNKRDKVILSANQKVADALKERIKDGSFLDVGVGAERYLPEYPELSSMMNISNTTLNNALKILEEEGYSVQTIKVKQVTNPSKSTTIKVLAPPGVTAKDIHQNKDMIKPVFDATVNPDGEVRMGVRYPESIDISRIKVAWPDEGGGEKDGLVEIRRGTKDLDLGTSSYAQVRIAVNDTHYIKGMAIYGDDKDFPPGVDVIVNTGKNKEKSQALGDVMKPMKLDKDNPFGAAMEIEKGELVGQSEYIGDDGKRYLSAINKVNSSGKWDQWSRNLPSQFLSKQNKDIIKKQLDLTYKEKKAELDDILSLTNNEVKRKLLADFAEDCDKEAVELKAAPFAGQAQKVILPVPSMSSTECYCPAYPTGTKLVLVRYPHAGTFELPVVTVNNNNVSARKIFTGVTSTDFVGIGPLTAQQLSGADFDGDSVTAIPLNEKNRIKTERYPDALKDFADFHERYRATPDMTPVKDDPSWNKQTKMGMVSNLITDMTLRGAPLDDVVKAVKHSMVIIDAEKHNLDWRRSYIDNDIESLQLKYQGKAKGGASTLISKAGGMSKEFPERADFQIDRDTDPETGKKIFRETGRKYFKADPKGDIVKYDPKTGKDIRGKMVLSMKQSTKMAETDDAYTLSSGHIKENLYADFANKMKAMANEARKLYLSTPHDPKDEEAAKKYSEEVKSLQAQLYLNELNAPRERYSQIAAHVIVEAKMKSNPALTYKTKEGKEKIRKAKNQALASARANYGARRKSIKISDKEWEAIQSHALGWTTVKKILDKADPERVRELATPRISDNKLSNAKISWIRSLKSSGYTSAEIAERTGISVGTISKYASD